MEVDYQRQGQRDLRRGHGDDEKGENLAVCTPPVGRPTHKSQDYGIEHDLDADQHHDDILPPGDQAEDSHGENQGGKNKEMGQRYDHLRLPR